MEAPVLRSKMSGEASGVKPAHVQQVVAPQGVSPEDMTCNRRHEGEGLSSPQSFDYTQTG